MLVYIAMTHRWVVGMPEMIHIHQDGALVTKCPGDPGAPDHDMHVHKYVRLHLNVCKTAILQISLVACRSCKKVLVLQGCYNHARLRGEILLSCRKYLANSILQETYANLQEPFKYLQGNSAWAVTQCTSIVVHQVNQ